MVVDIAKTIKKRKKAITNHIMDLLRHFSDWQGHSWHLNRTLTYVLENRWSLSHITFSISMTFGFFKCAKFIILAISSSISITVTIIICCARFLLSLLCPIPNLYFATPTTYLFLPRRRQTFYAYQWNLTYQMAVKLATFPHIKARQGNSAWKK